MKKAKSLYSPFFTKERKSGFCLLNLLKAFFRTGNTVLEKLSVIYPTGLGWSEVDVIDFLLS
ncbi:MAG: hypothetical protein LKE52_02410 [Bacilli bacterium]|jgi:hypothetical protein|nr:hypothetical protein [Bacilli bacterium]